MNPANVNRALKKVGNTLAHQPLDPFERLAVAMQLIYLSWDSAFPHSHVDLKKPISFFVRQECEKLPEGHPYKATRQEPKIGEPSQGPSSN